MTYLVKEIFYSLQGEGAHAGRPAVFLRFAGCNLWSGEERDRRTAICRFCDTDFTGGVVHDSAVQLADRVLYAWNDRNNEADKRFRFVVITGGEPAQQFDKPLLEALHERHFYVAIETNGTLPLAANPDWITVSPKTKTLRVTDGNELKLVFPSLPPALFEKHAFHIFSLSPKWEWQPWRRAANLRAAIRFCGVTPQWRLTEQHHKRWRLR